MTAVPTQGIEYANKLMQTGFLNRYQLPLDVDDDADDMRYLLQCEVALAQYLGVRYCIGLNSGASAIFMALKCAELPPGAPVLSNAFTFNAVPSSIVHAGGTPILVECDNMFLIDLDDLAEKAEATGAKYLVLSYMRGRIPDMDAVLELCNRYGLYLIEDAAHAYGCEWNGQKIGTFGHSATMSTQANKLMNSGEGGFLVTDEPEIMGKAICHAGSYEEYMLKHKEMCPAMELMVVYRETCINYSMRMTNLQGAILLPQVAVLDERRDSLNAAYEILTEKLNRDPRLHVPPQHAKVTPVYDSLQFHVRDATEEQITSILKYVKNTHKLKLAVFGAPTNARNWRTWKFIENLDTVELPKTDLHIKSAVDTRLDLGMTQTDIDTMVHAIVDGLDAVLGPLEA